MMKSYKEIVSKARELGGKKIVVAGAEGLAVLEAVSRARSQGITEPILVGVEKTIRQIAEEIEMDLSDVRIVQSEGAEESAHKAASLTAAGEAEAIMKGKVDTPVLLKAVLDKRYGLRSGNLLSHIALLEVPDYSRLLLVTDGGMVIRPDLDQKVQILKNGIGLMRRLGIQKPKCAVLAAIEKVNPDMPETVHARKLQEMCEEGVFGAAVVEGPLAVDVAFSMDAVRKKGLESHIKGEPDICLVPDIASGNIFAKGLWHLAKARIGGLILGTNKPVILLSRSDDAETKLNSIALGMVAG